MKKNQKGEAVLLLLASIAIVALVALAMWGLPTYSVWQQGLSGQAELARANQNRQIKVSEAQAAFESAKFLNLAEIERARGAAEANKILGDSLRNNEPYLRYLWIQTLSNENNKMIYVPTEAGIPILEAGKRGE